MPFIEVPDRIPGLHAKAQADRPWYRITNQTADEAEVMLYDEVGGWYGATAEVFIEELRSITAPKILLRVNSPGGVVTEGIAIANALRSHPANVTVQIDGIAASIASVIAMAGDRVRMMPNALLMVHEASGLCVGDAADMIKTAEVLNKISDNIAGAYAARAGGTEVEWRQVMKEETWYRGEEAVAAGLADECMPLPKRVDKPTEAEPEMRRDFDLTAYGYRGPRREEPAAPAADGLTADIRSLVGEEVAAALQVAAQPPADPPPVADAQPVPAAAAPQVTNAVAAPESVDQPAAPEAQQVVIQVHLDGRDINEVLADALRNAGAQQPGTGPETPPPAAPAPTGLAAATAHLKPTERPSPSWRDRVAHLNPPSAATTRTA